MILVSILVPIYNVEKYINRCLDSIFNQEVDNRFHVEYIFIDDRGTDGSISILEQKCKLFPDLNIRIVHNPQNKGLAYSRNVGVLNATGDYILHVDSDDFLEQDAIKKLVDKLEECNADIVVGNTFFVYSLGKKMYTDRIPPKKSDYIQKLLLRQSSFNIWGKLIKKSLYTENNISAIEGINQGEDYCVYPRLVWFANVIAKTESVVYNYEKTNQLSYSLSQKSLDSVRQIINAQKTLNCFFSDKISKDIVKSSSVMTVMLLISVSSYCNYSFIYDSFKNIEGNIVNLKWKHKVILLFLKLHLYKVVHFIICHFYHPSY